MFFVFLNLKLISCFNSFLSFDWILGVRLICNRTQNDAIWELIALFLTNQIAGNTIDFKMNVIKAVLLSRLAMTQDSIRNTHTQMLWEKGFRGETLPVLVTKYGQNVIPKTHVTLH